MRITGSKVHRIWKCQASAVLPQAYESNDASPAAKRGTAIHAFLEQVGKVGRGAALADAPAEVVPLLEALDLENLPVGLATEVSFAWNWQTLEVRELGRNLPRRPDGGVDYDGHGGLLRCIECRRNSDGYSICSECPRSVDWSCEVPLTIDVMGVAQAHDGARYGTLAVRRGYVGDYKSGHSKYPAPDMFGQTLLAAVCVAKVYGCDDVVVELLHIHDNGGHHAARRTVNEWDLQAFEAELQDAMRAIHPIVVGRYEGDAETLRSAIDRVRDQDMVVLSSSAETEIRGPVPLEGPWCDYCPAFRGCPKKLALVRAIPEQLVQLGVRPDPESGAMVLTPGALTVRNAAAAWEAIERIEDVLARAKEEICSIGWHEDIPLSDGRVIGRLVTERRDLNGKVAAELLRERYGAAAAQFIKESVTLAAMRQAVVKHIRPGEKIETKAKNGMYDKLLDEVERRGGLEVKTTDAVRPHVPKRK